MNVYTLTEIFEKSKLYMIIILRFETIQRKSVFRRVIYSTKYAFFFYSELFSFSPYNSKKLSRIIAEEISNSRTKNVPGHILAPAAVACDTYLVRRSAHP